jgi:D-alanyl-D-alanine carboxypeptidase/D-alanyl-D-alanine-endopeptidase (penicillin-binding protein 4)
VKVLNFIWFFFILAGLVANAQPNGNNIIKDFTSDPKLTGSSIGIYISDLSSGKSLVSANSNILLAPASTLKLLTSATALEIFGPDYRFKTGLGYSGNIDEKSGVLTGNLVVKGGGDPSLGSVWFEKEIKPEAFLDTWIEEMKKSGISKISGDLVMDISVFEGSTVPGSWTWEDIGNYYGAGPSALTVFDNLIRLYFDSPDKPGEPVRLVRTEPQVPGILWQNEVKSSVINRDMAYIYGSPWGDKRKITGTIPTGKKDFLVKASMPEPPLILGNLLQEKLLAAGIQVAGSVKVTAESQSVNQLATHSSPRLSDILKFLNHESINLFADHLVVQIDLEKTGKGSFEAGLNLIHKFWKENGIRDTFFIEDGSGLSRFDAISAEQMTRILSFMYQSRNKEFFLNSLPMAGKGTLSGFKTTDFPGTSLRCKSGSIDKVRCYAGYLTCDTGREVAFAVLVNNFSCTQTEMGRKLQKMLLDFKKTF